MTPKTLIAIMLTTAGCSSQGTSVPGGSSNMITSDGGVVSALARPPLHRTVSDTAATSGAPQRPVHRQRAAQPQTAPCYTDPGSYADLLSIRQNSAGAFAYGFDKLTAQLVVPPLPSSPNFANFSIWPGLYADDQGGQLLQPVLLYYDGPNGYRYYIGAAYNYEVQAGVTPVQPGDLINFEIVQETATSWLIVAEDVTRGVSNTVSYNGFLEMNTAQIAAFENSSGYEICSCGQVPVNYLNFTNVQLYMQSQYADGGVNWSAFVPTAYSPQPQGGFGGDSGTYTGTYINPDVYSTSVAACGWSLGWATMNDAGTSGPGNVALLGMYVE